MLEHFPATRQRLEEFYGHSPEGEITALVFHWDGAPAGVIGHTLVDGYRFAFSDMRPLPVPKLAIYRAAWLAVPLFLEPGPPVCATANPKYPGSGKLLRLLGFRFIEHNPICGDIYLCQV